MSVHYEVRDWPLPAGAAVHPLQPQGAPDCAALLRMATTGAIVGGTAAAAHQIRRLQSGAQSPQGALSETAKAAVTAGVATAAAGAIAASLAEQGLARLGLMFLVGTAVVYGLQSRLVSGGEEGA